MARSPSTALMAASASGDPGAWLCSERSGSLSQRSEKSETPSRHKNSVRARVAKSFRCAVVARGSSGMSPSNFIISSRAEESSGAAAKIVSGFPFIRTTVQSLWRSKSIATDFAPTRATFFPAARNDSTNVGTVRYLPPEISSPCLIESGSPMSIGWRELIAGRNSRLAASPLRFG